MYIRPHGNKSIQLIRVKYDPATKGGKQTVVALLPRGAIEIPSDIRDKLTPDEIAQVEAWLADRQAQVDAEMARWDMEVAGARLARIARVIPGHLAEMPDPAKVAADLHAQLNEIRIALRRAGHPQPKKTKPVAPATGGDNQDQGQLPV